MPGFKLNRPDGSIAIDSNYFNLALREKGSAVIANQPNPNTPGFRNLYMTLGGDQAIIAYRSASPVAMYQARKLGGAIEYVFCGMSEHQPITLDWWVFDLPQYAQQFANSGKMIVRRPTDGAVVFDSRNKYMKIMDFIHPENTAEQRRSYPKLPAVIMTNRYWSDIAQPINAGNSTLLQSQTYMARTEGNDVVTGGQITSLSIAGSDNPKFAYAGGSPEFLVVDVQDY